jgi:hypothetical protein
MNTKDKVIYDRRYIIEDITSRERKEKEKDI